MVVIASLIPRLGFVVVGALCQATIPLSGSEARVGSITTPSVLVPPTSTPMRSFFVPSPELIVTVSVEGFLELTVVHSFLIVSRSGGFGSSDAKLINLMEGESKAADCQV